MVSIAERHKYILDQLNKQKFIKVAEIAKDLGITTVTIRKDLKYLESKKLLFRTHGSASPINPHVPDRGVYVKEKIKNEEKRKIGVAAAKLIEENDSIIIASGSTIFAFAQEIAPLQHLNVVTPSLRVAILLSEQENISIVQLGGNLYKNSLSVRGEYALQVFNDFTCSKVFMGVDGIDGDYGITTSTLEEAQLSKKMMEASSRTIILADSSKFGKRGFGKICSLDRIDVIVTDNGITESAIKMVEDNGIELIIAE